MTDSVREQLLGYLLGALEDSEQQEVETRLKDDPQWHRELTLIRNRLQDHDRLVDQGVLYCVG